MNLPHIVALTPTKGRHLLLRRNVRCFIEQDYKGPHTQIIFNNSEVPQELDLQEDLASNKNIILVNQHLNSITGLPYNSLGEIYNDILKYLPFDADIINHFEDDDIFLKNHLSEGVKGMQEAWEQNKEAYKPKRSYFLNGGSLTLESNVLEPSIFFSAKIVREVGYRDSTTTQFHDIINYLGYNDKLLVKEAPSTFIYTWGERIPTYKTSGSDHETNFQDYAKFSNDHGDGKIIPMPLSIVEKFYKEHLHGMKEQNVYN